MNFLEISLAEIRKDCYINDKFVLIPNIVNKPDNLGKINKINNDLSKIMDKNNCPYCIGKDQFSEQLILSFVFKDGMLQRLYDSEDRFDENWSIRIFECKNPIVSTNPNHEYSDKPYYREPAYGYDLIVIPTPEHDVSLSDLSIEQWTNLLLVLQDRVRWLYSQRGVAYVAIYASRGSDCSSAISHPHFHITTFSSIPPVIEKEAKTFHQLMTESGLCPTCNMLESEINGPRQLFSTSHFITLVPWAPTYNCEFWICPRKHSISFSKTSQKEIMDLSLVICSSMRGMDNVLGKNDFTIAFHISPEKKNSRQLHWHIEIYPIITAWSGLERGFGIFVNHPNPEYSAEILGSASRKELAKLMGIV
ncbi:MAG: galactose-1-phosphate uridylyltransferase [Candidatus Nitrosocosmicus sp.]